MERRAWQATAHEVAKSQNNRSNLAASSSNEGKGEFVGLEELFFLWGPIYFPTDYITASRALENALDLTGSNSSRKSLSS